MKKLVVFLLLVCAIFSTSFFKVEKNPLFAMADVEKVCFVQNRQIANENVESVHCGDLVFNFCSLETAKENLNEFQKQTKSIQFYLKDRTLSEILNMLKAKVVTKEMFDEFCVVYAHTPYHHGFIQIDGKKVNLQIVSRGNEIIAGFPAILTGF